MSTQWETANHCHSALSVLSANIQHSMHDSASGLQTNVPPTTETDNTSSNNHNNEDGNNPRPKKRKLRTYPADDNDNEDTQTPPTTATTGNAIRIPNSIASSSTTRDQQPQYPASSASASTSSAAQLRPPALDPFSTPDIIDHNHNQNHNHAPTPLLYFPDAQYPLSPYPASPRAPGVGNFDLNMGDLLAGSAPSATGEPGLDAGAGFDSFLDLFGGQFPGF